MLLPVRLEVDVELNEFDRSIGCQLANNGESRNECACDDENPVVGPARYQHGKFMKSDGESFHDAQQLEHLEVVCRGLTVRTALGWQLTVEILEEIERCTNK